MKSNDLRIGVLYSCYDQHGNKEVEEDLKSFGVSARTALKKFGHSADLLNLDEVGFAKAKEYDILFNVCERLNGDAQKEPHIASALELLGVHITGSPGESIARCHNKVNIKKKAIELGVPTPRFFEFSKAGQTIPDDFPFPAVVKPTATHNSIGIDEDSLVHSKEQAQKRAQYILDTFKQHALIEQFIEGKDVEITVLGNGSRLAAYGMEVYYPYNNGKDPALFCYESKWNKKSTKYGDYRPVSEVSRYKMQEILKVAKNCYRAYGLRDYGRVDFRVTPEGKFYLIEINANTGLSEECSTIRGAVAMGLDQTTIMYEIFRIAAARCGLMKGKKLLA